MAFFQEIPSYPSDPVFGVTVRFKEDPREHKVDLTVGVYYNEHNRPQMMRAAKEAEKRVVEKNTLGTYLPFFGYEPFIESIGPLILGGSFWKSQRSRIYACQALGGTGSLNIIADFLKNEIGHPIYRPEPTWPNHDMIFSTAGLDVKSYPHYDGKAHGIDFVKTLSFLKELGRGSIIVFHASCHNPTGCDFTEEQWKELSLLCKQKGFLPFFDIAYQGLGRGIEEDARSIRIFAEDGHEMVIAATQSKNFSLYSHRIGASFVIAEDPALIKKIHSAFRIVIRPTYSSPSLHGAAVIAEILENPDLRNAWEKELDQMRGRIHKMQDLLSGGLIKKSKKKDFSFLKGKVGLFAYTELSEDQVEKLITDHGVYLTPNGRLNVTRIDEKELDYIIDSILDVCE